MNENIFAGRNSDLLSSLASFSEAHRFPFHPPDLSGFQPWGSGRGVEGFTSGRPNPRLAETSNKQTLHITLPLPPRCYEKIEQQQYSFGRRIEEGKEKEQGRGVRRSQRPQAGAWVGGPKGREASLTSLSPDGLRLAGYKGRWGAPPASPAPAEPLNAVVSAMLT